MASQTKKKDQKKDAEVTEEEATEEAAADAAENGKSKNGEADERQAEEDAAAEEATTSDVTSTDEENAEAPEDVGTAEEEAPPIEVPDEAIRLEVDFETYPAGAFTHEDLDLSGDDVQAMYRSMLLQRRFEERCRQQYQKQNISGFLHLYIGQEAVSTGSVAAVRLGEDTIITAYRDHGMALAMNLDPKACMAELFGKETGVSRGKGGSMHFFSEEQRLFGGHAIVGAHLPLAAGIAFAQKYREEDTVCLCFFGDGAVQQGAFHEAFNLAGLYDLPVVFVCENNRYGMGTSIERAAAEPDLFKQAVGYKMPGALVNGMDVFSVNKAVRAHVDLAREGQPSFIEIRTYRYQGHSISDPASYRAEGELDRYKGQDPIIRLQKYMVENDFTEEDALAEIDEEIKQEVLDAIDFAEESDLPPEEALYEHVYAQEDYPFIA